MPYDLAVSWEGLAGSGLERWADGSNTVLPSLRKFLLERGE